MEQTRIHQNLHWAFEEGRYVSTPAGSGKTKRHQLTNLVLPSGKIATGRPGDDLINEPNQIQPQVSPGSYPVFISIVQGKHGHSVFAFLSVIFINAKVISWEPAGHFFTDSGDGCIFDASLTDIFSKKKDEISREEWGLLKSATLQDGDGRLWLDEPSGMSAIIFRTCDWPYPCFVGRDNNGQISSFVIDGRTHRPKESIFRSFVSFFLRKV